MGRLTTHVLDTMSGKPAAGLKLELWQMAASERHLKNVYTNADWRVGAAVLEGA